MGTAWLESVCEDPKYRPALSTPMTVKRNEQYFTVATDGHRLVELPGSYGEYRTPSVDMLPSLAKVIAPTPQGALPFSWVELQTFIRSALVGVVRTCSRCGNEGWIAGRAHRVSHLCPTCEGAVIAPKQVYIGGILFNARLFEPFVENLPDVEPVRFAAKSKTEQVVFDGGAWRIIVMPLREDEPRDYPRFEIEGAEAIAARRRRRYCASRPTLCCR